MVIGWEVVGWVGVDVEEVVYGVVVFGLIEVV